MKIKNANNPKRDALINLRLEAQILWERLDELFERAIKITKEKNRDGYTFDYIYNIDKKSVYEAVDDLIKKLGAN